MYDCVSYRSVLVVELFAGSGFVVIVVRVVSVEELISGVGTVDCRDKVLDLSETWRRQLYD